MHFSLFSHKHFFKLVIKMHGREKHISVQENQAPAHMYLKNAC